MEKAEGPSQLAWHPFSLRFHSSQAVEGFPLDS